LPKESGTGVNYRFQKGDSVSVWGWRNFSGSVDAFDISDSLTLMNALSFGVSIAAVALTPLALNL
jgi:hypothetical protein